MVETDLVCRIVREIGGGVPWRLAEDVSRAFRTAIDAREARVLLLNYRLATLRRLGAREEEPGIPLANTPAGRALLQRRTIVQHEGAGGEATAYVPIVSIGDPHGVLELHVVDAGVLPAEHELGRAGEMIGWVLQSGSRATELFQRTRRGRRLTLAAEMQWDLLPARAGGDGAWTLAGQLEPAYSVAGDTFDWSANGQSLQLAVCDGMGFGASASLLSSLAVTALRNARRSDLELAEQASMVDQALFAQYGGERFVSALLAELDETTGRVDIVQAGCPPPMRLRPDGAIEIVELEGSLPFGMFELTPYAVETVELAPGDRLLMISDGLLNAASARGEAFAERILPRVLRATRRQDPVDVVREAVRELLDHVPDAELRDDAVVLCLDWAGPPGRLAGLPPA